MPLFFVSTLTSILVVSLAITRLISHSDSRPKTGLKAPFWQLIWLLIIKRILCWPETRFSNTWLFSEMCMRLIVQIDTSLKVTCHPDNALSAVWLYSMRMYLLLVPFSVIRRKLQAFPPGTLYKWSKITASKNAYTCSLPVLSKTWVRSNLGPSVN